MNWDQSRRARLSFHGQAHPAGRAAPGPRHGFPADPNKNGGVLTTLHRFSGGADGNVPTDKLAQGADGNLYGATTTGGAYNGGVVFRVSPGGEFTVLHSFGGGDDGALPSAPAQGLDGNFYGVTNGPASKWVARRKQSLASSARHPPRGLQELPFAIRLPGRRKLNPSEYEAEIERAGPEDLTEGFLSLEDNHKPGEVSYPNRRILRHGGRRDVEKMTGHSETGMVVEEVFVSSVGVQALSGILSGRGAQMEANGCLLGQPPP